MTHQQSLKSIAGVRFSSAGPLFFCQTGQQKPALGDRVIVLTGDGERTGIIALLPATIEAVQLDQEFPPLIRILNDRIATTLLQPPAPTATLVTSRPLALPCNRQPCCREWASEHLPGCQHVHPANETGIIGLIGQPVCLTEAAAASYLTPTDGLPTRKDT